MIKVVLLITIATTALQGCSLIGEMLGLSLTSVASSGDPAYVVAANSGSEEGTSNDPLYGVFPGSRPQVTDTTEESLDHQ